MSHGLQKTIVHLLQQRNRFYENYRAYMSKRERKIIKIKRMLGVIKRGVVKDKMILLKS